jgi:transglutaminase-like putative cysteine protease
MPVLYKTITAVLALTGCISLLLTGQLNLLMCLSGLAALPGYYRFLKGMPPAPRWAVGVFSLLTLLVFLADSLIISRDVFLAVAHLTIIFQAIKSFDLKEPWDHLQVYFMALLQLIIASDLTGSLLFGVVFVVFMVLLVTAMVLSHFLKEGALGRVRVIKPVFLISLCTLFMTAMIFLLFPRTSEKFFGKSHSRGIKTAGFSERVDFGSFGDLKLDPTVVMRVEMDRDISPLYWRGLALDYFDGRSWRNTREENYRVDRSGDKFRAERCDKNRIIEQRIYMEPIDSDIIFGLSKICMIKAEGFYPSIDPGKSVSLHHKSSRRVEFSMYSDVNEEYGGQADEGYLQLPGGTEKIEALANKVTAGIEPDEQKAVAIARYLRKNYKYSLRTVAPPRGVSPIEDFLFRTKRGYCEHYATSMTLMLRSLGIPSRVVNGYLGGEKNEYGGYIIIRQSNAHSWVEALLDSRWKRFDPTPASPVLLPSGLALFIDSLQLNWSRYVVGFSSADQREIMRGLSVPFRPVQFSGLKRSDLKGLFYNGLIVSLLGLLVYSYSRVRRIRKLGIITERYLTLRKKFRRKGLVMQRSVTARDIRQAGESLGITGDLEEFLRIYEEHRFGKRDLSTEDRERYERLLKELKKKMC